MSKWRKFPTTLFLIGFSAGQVMRSAFIDHNDNAKVALLFIFLAGISYIRDMETFYEMET